MYGVAGADFPMLIQDLKYSPSIIFSVIDNALAINFFSILFTPPLPEKLPRLHRIRILEMFSVPNR
jgi:hypothetical protein